MHARSWLFVKDARSMWVERQERHLVRIAGPGAVRERHSFTDEASVEDFLTTLAEDLIGNGWILSQIDYDRRRLARRRHLRIAPDRRDYP